MEPARNGRADDLERYRAYLHLLAQLDLDPRLQGKLDLSGVVQQTLFEAHRNHSDFNGQGESAFLTWLRTILARNLLDEVRKLRRTGFDATRDRALDEFSPRAAWLAADQSSPGERASRNEQILRLACALEELPVDQRTAVMRHHLQGISLADVAGEMGRSKPAVAGLLHRGLKALRNRLVSDESSNNGAAGGRI